MVGTGPLITLLLLTMLQDFSGLLVPSVITAVDGRFSVVLPVSHVNAASTIACPRLSSLGFSVVVVPGFSAIDVMGAGLGAEFLVAVFSSSAKAASAITGPGLSSAGFSVVVVPGFSAVDIIGTGLGAEFSVVTLRLADLFLRGIMGVVLQKLVVKLRDGSCVMEAV
jgi:stage V sporulation protein SpoVS